MRKKESIAAHVECLLKYANVNLDSIPDNSCNNVNDISRAGYQESFADEGERKTRFIREDLNDRQARGEIKMENILVISIGSADGSDVNSLLEKTPIRKGIVLEPSKEGANKARDFESKWSKKGKHFSVEQGDAEMLKEDLKTYIKEAKSKNYTHLVQIYLGVMHELPSRSTEKYDPKSYIGQLADICPNNSIYISEPCAPQNWPDTIELKIDDCESELLERFSKYIKKGFDWKRHMVEPEAISKGFVRMDKELAGETLFKIIRKHDAKRHRYEMGERMTSFDPEDIKSKLVDIFTSPVLETSMIYGQSGGYRKAYINCDVNARSADGKVLPIPISHVKIMAHDIQPDQKKNKVNQLIGRFSLILLSN